MPVWLFRQMVPNSEFVLWLAFLNREAAQKMRAAKKG